MDQTRKIIGQNIVIPAGSIEWIKGTVKPVKSVVKDLVGNFRHECMGKAQGEIRFVSVIADLPDRLGIAWKMGMRAHAAAFKCDPVGPQIAIFNRNGIDLHLLCDLLCDDVIGQAIGII